MRTEPWTVKHLKEAMVESLLMCQTEHERLMCRTICNKEMREFADHIQKSRKLTPGEESILFGGKSQVARK